MFFFTIVGIISS